MSDPASNSAPKLRGQRTWLWCRRNPVVAGLLASLVSGLAGTTFLAIQVSNNARDFRDQKAIAQNAAAEADKKRLEVEKQYGQLRERFQNFYDLLIVSAERAFSTGDFADAATFLDGCPAELRNFEWRLRERLLEGSVLTRPVANGNLQAMAVSPDGKRVATGGNRGTNPDSFEPVRIWDTATWELKAEFGEGAYQLAFSPDSKQLAVGWSDSTSLWDIAEKKPLVTLPASHGGLAFSPDGKLLAIGLDKAVCLYVATAPPAVKDSNGADGRMGERAISPPAIDKPVKTLTGSVAFVKSLAFSPDGKRLVAMSGVFDPPIGDRAQPQPSDIKVWELESERAIWELNNIEDASWDLMAVNRAGDRCAVAIGEDNHVQLSNLNEKKEPISIALPTGVTALAFSPTGEDLYAGDRLGNIHVIDVESQEIAATLSGHTRAVLSIGFLGDDRLLTASRDDTLKVWERDRQAGTPYQLPGHAPFAFSGDGGQIAAATPTGEIRCWDLRTKAELRGLLAMPLDKLARELSRPREAVPEKSDPNPSRDAFSPDGSRIARIAGKTLQIIDAKTARGLIVLIAPGSITSAEFSPDGERLAVAGEFGIEIYDAAPSPTFFPPPARLRSK